MDPYIGEIRIFSGTFAPQGWLLCNGATVVISDYNELFQLIGTTYGGDGQSNFNLPDLRSRVPIHRAPGSRPLGSTGGAETVSLQAGQLPVHNHPASGAATGTTSSPSGAVWGGATTLKQYVAGSQVNGSLNAAAIGSTGSGAAHNNLMPYLALNFIIATVGIYPTQN